MTRRGRRPYPDILTPREWEVLTLLREGRSNPEIAAQIGVSRDAVKYHVSEILSKLGLESREEAAAWQPEPPELPVLRPAWARALAGWPLRIALAGAAAAALAGVGVLAYGALRSDDSSGNQVQATASAAASATPRRVVVQPGQTIQVQTRGALPTSTGSCEDIFVDLDVPNDVLPNVVSCTVGLEAQRLLFVDAGNGALRLDSVQMVLLGNQAITLQSDCASIVDLLLDASMDPSTALEQIACNVPLPRTDTVSWKIVWAHVNPDADVSSGPQPCWLLAPAAGGVGDGVQQKAVQCAINVPATATPVPVAFTTAAPASLPPNLSVIIETGCCETDMTGLIRVTRSAAGVATRDVLFSAGTHVFTTASGSTDTRDDYEAGGVTVPTPNPQAPGKAPAEDRPYIATYGVSANSRAMVVGLCIRGACMGVNAAPNDQGITQLYRSLDGGTTWSEFKQLGPYVLIAGVTGDGRVLIEDATAGLKSSSYRWEPDGETVTPPVLVAGSPAVLLDGRIVWPGPLGTLYFNDGTILASGLGLPSPGPVLDLGDGRYAVQGQSGLTIINADRSSETYAATGSVYLGNNVFVGMADVPEIVDLSARTITPLDHPFRDVGFDYPMFLVLAGAVSTGP
jgi:DNA-binding CsgD family transcriptional regulator